MAWEVFPEWFRRRMRRTPFVRNWFFSDLEEMMSNIEEMLERARIPKDLIRERKLSDGSTTHDWGPFVYGYSVTVGPDGKPKIREFGNIKPSRKSIGFGFTRPDLNIKEEREPLIDVISTDGEIKVVAELPGVEKEDIKLSGTEDKLTISVEAPERKYFKEIEMPSKIDPKKAKTSYKNGVLEVTVPKIEEKKKPSGEQIKIDRSMDAQ